MFGEALCRPSWHSGLWDGGCLETGHGFSAIQHDADWIECPERRKKSESQPWCGLSSRAGAWCAAEVRSQVRSQAGATRSLWARLPFTGHLLCVCCFPKPLCVPNVTLEVGHHNSCFTASQIRSTEERKVAWDLPEEGKELALGENGRVESWVFAHCSLTFGCCKGWEIPVFVSVVSH